MKQFYLIFYLFFLAACNFQSKTDFEFSSFYSKNIDNNSYILYHDTLPLVHSIQYYRVHTRLYKENSYFILHSHFIDFDKGGGMKLQIVRDQKSLKVFIASPSYPKKLLFEDPIYFEQTSEVFFTFEVSNTWTNDNYVRLWNNYRNIKGDVKNTYLPLREDYNLLADSRDQNIIFFSKGRGLK